MPAHPTLRHNRRPPPPTRPVASAWSTRWSALRSTTVPVRFPWPFPAVAAWALGWMVLLVSGAAGLSPDIAFASGLLASSAAAWCNAGHWRRLIAAAGFPLSALVLGSAAGMPPWLWLLLLAPVLLAYPLRAWRDAPFFPTPADALQGLDNIVGTPRHVLDAGCGLGHGLAALHRLWPTAQLHGIEWSPVLAWATAWRARLQGRAGMHIQRGDMWAPSWAAHDLVYVFQRPESMARAFDKAQRELAPGAWFVSLEFAVPDQAPVAVLQGGGRRPVWIYQPAASAQRSTTGTRGR